VFSSFIVQLFLSLEDLMRGVQVLVIDCFGFRYHQTLCSFIRLILEMVLETLYFEKSPSIYNVYNLNAWG